MTIGKRFLSLIMLLIISVTLCLPSCKGGSDGSDETDDALSMLLEIVDSEETTASSSYYVVIIPANCSAALAQKAAELAEGLEEITGIESVVEYENKLTSGRENATNIILGNTGLDESAIAFAKLREGDYVCKKVNGSIVIGGLSDEATVEALDRFIKDVLPYATAEELMSPSAEFEYFADHENDTTLCGFPLKDFNIVCEFGTVSEELALKLSERIGEFSGDVLRVFDTVNRRENVKEIVFELSPNIESADKAYVLRDREDVVLRACDEYGLSVIFEYFCSIVLSESEQADAIVTTCDWKERIVGYENPELVVEYVAADVSRHGFDKIAYVSAVADRASAGSPDLMLVNAVDTDTGEMLKFVLPETYGVETLEMSNGVVLVIYEKAALDVTCTKSEYTDAAEINISLAAGEKYDILYLCGKYYESQMSGAAVSPSGIVVVERDAESSLEKIGFTDASEIVSAASVSSDKAVSVFTGGNIKNISTSVQPIQHGQTDIGATVVQMSVKKLFAKTDF